MWVRGLLGLPRGGGGDGKCILHTIRGPSSGPSC